MTYSKAVWVVIVFHLFFAVEPHATLRHLTNEGPLAICKPTKGKVPTRFQWVIQQKGTIHTTHWHLSLSPFPSPTQKTMTALLQQLSEAEALFDADRFAECKVACQAALTATEGGVPPDVAKRLKLLVKKCNLNLPAAAAPPSLPQAVSASATASSSRQEESTTAPAAAASPPTSSTTLPVTAPRFEWFQSPTTVTLTFYIKGRSDADLGVDATDHSITVCIRLGDNRDYTYTVETLYGTIDAAKITKSVRPTKIEVVLPKSAGGGPMWPTIEMKGGDLVTAHNASHAPVSTQKDLPLPSNRGVNWNGWKVSAEDQREFDSLGAPNASLQLIYQHADDDQRKAIIKSFTESNGTVMSCNWQDVGSRYVQGTAPKGSEMKPWKE